MKKIDPRYVIQVEQVLQRIHYKYTVYDLKFIIIAFLTSLYFESMATSLSVMIFELVIYHRVFVKSKRADFSELFLIKLISDFIEIMRRDFKRSKLM